MKVEKLKISFFLRLILLVSSLVLLSVILVLIISFEIPFFDPKLSTLKSILTFLLIPTLIIIGIFGALTIKEYRNYFSRKSYIQKGRSYLTLTDVFDNENRLNILKQILNNPGIHHNELLRTCNLQKGQLQWHLDILLKYRIIKKEKLGQYTIYFPITSSSEKNDYLETPISKSKTTSEILAIVNKNPGINSSEIARTLSLSRNTIKYHIDKLTKEKLVTSIKKGRKMELYPIRN
jgi:DNA-binding transcriptional ArsR family regulator